jgi:hypothetical protein
MILLGLWLGFLFGVGITLTVINYLENKKEVQSHDR